MNKELMIKTAFLVPVTSDRYFGDGNPHSDQSWSELEEVLTEMFGGCTFGGFVEGMYRNGNGVKVVDKSRRYEVAITRDDLECMCSFLKDVSKAFGQECIYFEHEGQVDFIYAQGPKEHKEKEYKEYEPTEEEWAKIEQAILEEEEEERRVAEEEDQKELSALKKWMREHGLLWKEDHIKEDHNG